MNLCAVIVALVPVAYHGQPAWFDTMLAGYAFEYDEQHRPITVHDAKTGFYLVRSVDCDGAFVRLLLTRDRKLVSEMGVGVPGFNDADPYEIAVEKPLPSLSTGKGLKIGDSEARMRALLGSPSKASVEGSRSQFRVCSYKWKSPKNKDDISVTYDQRYTFKAGRLIEVEFWKSAD